MCTPDVSVLDAAGSLSQRLNCCSAPRGPQEPAVHTAGDTSEGSQGGWSEEENTTVEPCDQRPVGVYIKPEEPNVFLATEETDELNLS